jgi:multiple sugar transport system permease protein
MGYDNCVRQTRFIFAVLVEILLCAMAICSDAREDDRPTLRLWNIPLEHDYNPFMKVARGVFDEFRITHPEIRLLPVQQLMIGGDVREAQFLMAMAGGTAPEVITGVPVRTFTTYLEKGFFQEMDRFVAPDEIESIHPEIRKVIMRDGHIYGLPEAYYAHCLIYRKAAFVEAGLDPNRGPRDWDEFYKYCRALSRPDEGKFGLGLVTGWQAGWFWTNFVWQAGGETIRQRPDGKWEAVYNSPEAIKATEYFCRKLVWGEWNRGGKRYKGVVYKESDGAKLIEDMGLGRIAMFIGAPIMLNLVPLQQNWGLGPDDIGIAPLPRGPAGKATILGANMDCINVTITDPETIAAAAQYAKYVCGDEGKRVSTRLQIENGWGAFVEPTLLRKFGHTDILARLDPEWVRTFDELLSYARVEPFCPGYQNIQTLALAEALDTIMYNENADIKTVLDASVSKVNNDILGIKPPEVLNRQRAVGKIVFILLMVIAAGFILRMIRELRSVAGAETRRVSRRRTGRFVPWLFMVPALLSILVWGYVPLVRGAAIAFLDYRIVGTSLWVGLDNFVDAFTRPALWLSLKNTVVYVSLSLGIGFFIPIILAILVTEVPRGKVLFRTIYYLPAATSGLVIMFLWRWFYEPTPQGLLNSIVQFFGMSPQKWLDDPGLAMVCVVIPAIWGGAGPASLIYQAALKTVPEEHYEAADLDGAGILRKVWSITLPTIKPLIIINFVGAFIGAFKAMETIFVMTGGGPAKATYTIGMEIFFNAYLFLNFGYATAVAWILGSLLIGFTVYQLRVLKKLEFTAAGVATGVRE